jgi:hypothetical protein
VLTDSALVEAARGGDHAAFAELLARDSDRGWLASR